MTLSFPLGVGLGGTFTELEGTADGGGGGHGLIGVTGSNASRCVSFSITMVPRLGTHISCDNDSNITFVVLATLPSPQVSGEGPVLV